MKFDVIIIAILSSNFKISSISFRNPSNSSDSSDLFTVNFFTFVALPFFLN